MRRLLSAATAAGLLAVSVSMAPFAGAAPTPEFEPEPIAWGPCADESLQKAGAECGMLEVPMDYGKPDGERVSIAVSRIKAKVPADKYQGVMLVNPGGPGGSGLRLSRLGQFVPNKVGEAYDWIGFDPRGVGSSQPKASCDPNYFAHNRPDYRPTTPEITEEWLARSEGYTDACKANGKLLDHIKTTDTVEDMDSLRKALGQEKINYYGFSYGTYLGQVYGTLHPERMRRVVMDGVVNVKDVWYQANQNQDVAFEGNIQNYFEWIAQYDSVFHLGTTKDEVTKKYYEQLDKLDKEPAGGKIGSSEWADIFLSAGYGHGNWEAIAAAFSGWVNKGEVEPMVRLYDDANSVGDDNSFAMYVGTQCSDVQWPRDWKQWETDNWATYEKAPFYTWANAWFNAPCLTWPAKAGTPVEVDGSKVESALLISEELDGATPFPGALEARKRFPNSSLISLPGGTTHSGSLGGNACLDNQIADYLATGKLPERKPGDGPDTTCEPLPEPVPQGGSHTAGKGNSQPEVLTDSLRSAHVR